MLEVNWEPVGSKGKKKFRKDMTCCLARKVTIHYDETTVAFAPQIPDLGPKQESHHFNGKSCLISYEVLT